VSNKKAVLYLHQMKLREILIVVDRSLETCRIFRREKMTNFIIFQLMMA